MDGTTKRLLLAILCGTALGLIGGAGVVVHDGRNMSAGLVTGGVLFLLGFGVAFSRPLRRLAELLSAIH